jgi:transcriptional regulator with XRE-family HTH domain
MAMLSPSQQIALGLLWRLRRVFGGLRQVDVARRCGITTSHLSQIERGETEASDLDQELLDKVLPPLTITPDKEAVGFRRRHDGTPKPD